MAVGTGGRVAPEAGPSEEYEEISLVDIVRVLYRRRLVLIIALLAALAAGAALTYFTTPQYEAKATLIPLEHETIITNWLGSRQAAEFAAAQTGDQLNPVLFGDRWNAAAGGWVGAPPTGSEIGLALSSHVRVTGGAKVGAPITVAISLPDAVLARDVAASYVESLDQLRPQLENITRGQLFDKYYAETGNAQEAQRRAETVANEKSYWLAFDSPTVPDSPVKPKPVLYMALATVLGLMGGMVLVFLLEWLSKYRGEFTRVDPPAR